MCLLRTGDTEKITFFANVCRNRETYILAANYLQTLDWHNDSQAIETIKHFYAKVSGEITYSQDLSNFWQHLWTMWQQ